MSVSLTSTARVIDLRYLSTMLNPKGGRSPDLRRNSIECVAQSGNPAADTTAVAANSRTTSRSKARHNDRHSFRTRLAKTRLTMALNSRESHNVLIHSIATKRTFFVPTPRLAGPAILGGVFSYYGSRAIPAAAGVLLACLAGSASALNGNTLLSSCSCSTTTGFSGQALNDAGNRGGPTLVTVVSTSVGMTAFMKVTGHYVTGTNGEPYWTATTATPVDASGTSLAGVSEAELESSYLTFDQMAFGVSRSKPIQVTELTEYASSFINSLEEEVEPGIAPSLLAIGILVSDIPLGTVITVKFQDGTTAQYVKISATASYMFAYNGVAHNAAGQRIERNGSLYGNPNTAGTGAGGYSGHGFGDGASVDFTSWDSNACVTTTTITVGGEATSYLYVAPC